MAPMLFAKAILNNEVFNHGNMSRDFTYVAGIIKVIDNPVKTESNLAPYKIYNCLILE